MPRPGARRSRAQRRMQALVTALAVLGLLVVDVAPAAAADSIAPVVTVSASSALAAQGVPITVSASAADAASKVVSAEISVDGGAWSAMNPSVGAIAPTRGSTALVNAAVLDVEAGYEASCALMADHTVWCWGSGHHGALGNGSEASSGPARVPGLSNVARLSVGGDHTCVVLTDGSVQCWGEDYDGQLGVGGSFDFRTSPTPVGLPAKAAAVSAGFEHTCALLVTGGVACWGRNFEGQLGYAPNSGSPTPVIVAGISTAIAVAVGEFHTCALLADHTIRCWGENTSGELGDGTTSGRGPVQVVGISTATAISMGGEFGCARLSNSTIKCWGTNDYQELGNGTTDPSSTPVSVGGIANATSVAAGAGEACARRSTCIVTCWGGNHGPIDVAGLTQAASVSATMQSHCSRLTTGSIRCWGDNANGQLGFSTFNGSLVPLTVGGIATATGVAAGPAHACTVLADHTIRCWGPDDWGQLGDGTHNASPTPVAVAGIANAASVDVGDTHTCALLTTGSVKCWGTDFVFETDTPITIAGVANATRLSVGGHSSCAVLADHTVRCWGFNDQGQLGDGTKTDRAAGVAVSGITTAVDVSMGESHACAALSTGGVLCWGDGADGELGNGAKASSNLPVTVTGIANAVAVAVGDDSSCALKSDGTVACWGTEAVGQLGNGGGLNDVATTPVAVTGLSGGASIDSGPATVCIARAAGTAACWGAGGSGELGNDTSGDSAAPVAVYGVPGIAALATGAGYDCARLTSGSLECWGEGGGGQLGVVLPSRPSIAPPDGFIGPLSAGSHHACVRATDFYGNTSAGIDCVTLAISDATAPVMGTPVTALRTGLPLSSGAVRMSVTWPGNDNSGGSGIAFYTLGSSFDGGTTWGTVNSSLTAPSDNVRTGTSGTFEFRVMAVDKASNVGPWTNGPNLMARLVQNTSSAITPVGTWATETSTTDSGGSALYSSQAAASVSTTFTGTSIALVTTMGPDRGAFKVYVDGTLDKTVDAYSATTQRQMQAWAKTFSASGKHTIKVVVVGTTGRPRVDVDAFATLALASSTGPGPTPPTTGGGIPTPPNTGTLDGSGHASPDTALLWAALIVFAGVQLAAIAAWTARRGRSRRRPGR